MLEKTDSGAGIASEFLYENCPRIDNFRAGEVKWIRKNRHWHRS